MTDDRHAPRIPALALAIAISAAVVVAAPVAAADPGPRPTTFQARVPRCDAVVAGRWRAVDWSAGGAALLVGLALWGVLRRRKGSRRRALVAGICAGLGAGAAVALIGPGKRPKVERAGAVVETGERALGRGKWIVFADTAHARFEREVPAGAAVKCSVVRAPVPCVEKLDGGAEIRRCGARRTPETLGPRRRVAVVAAAPGDEAAGALATALLDGGEADAVLIAEAFRAHLAPLYRHVLLDEDAAANVVAREIFVFPEGRERPEIPAPPVPASPAAPRIVVSGSLSDLARALAFTGRRPLRAVWPAATVARGDSAAIELSGDQEEPCAAGMVRVPGGTFAMGSPEGQGGKDEHPQHVVMLGPYCIDRTEVTVAAYAKCVDAGACRAADTGLHCNAAEKDRGAHPVNCVDWTSADAYCRWAGGHLPTEAEWEYAAKGAGGRRYPWGDQPPDETLVNACGAECVAAHPELSKGTMYDGRDGWPETAPVGSYPRGASPFGALDMAGNVWEWVADWYGPYVGSTTPAVDPRGPDHAVDRSRRGMRGGGWGNANATRLGTVRRDYDELANQGFALGFRCAR